MGTTQRIVPGVSGEPNWGNLNKSVTNVSKTVEQEKQLDSTATDLNPEDIATRYRSIEQRRNALVKSALSNLIRTGGGSTRISGRSSNSIGRAGSRSARRLAGFIASVGSGGLQSALSSIGFGSLAGKTLTQVIDFLLAYSSDISNGMDETAANKASCEVLGEIAEQVTTIEELENLMSSYINGSNLQNLICRYFGIYIFEHLSQRFEEKITQNKGQEISRDTFGSIKEYVVNSITSLHLDTPLNNIDWAGSQGVSEIEKIFDSVIKIFE